MSKKIMVISSSLDPRLVGAVEAARALGMETVACTREVDDGTLAHADRFYSVDGHKTEELLENLSFRQRLLPKSSDCPATARTV